MAAQSSSTSFPFPILLLQHPLSSSKDLPNSWILEFILRQPIPDAIISQLFLSLPLSSPEIHPHIRKTLLLRRLSSDLRRRSLSERTLHSLELLADLGRQCGIAPSHLLKTAYCAAAVECAAAAFLRSGGDFVDVVEKIWMAEAVEGLVSEEFLAWGKRLERCVLTGEACEEMLKRDVEVGMKSVRDYLEAALREMGPSFLEILAAELEGKRMDLDDVGRGFMGQVGDFKSFMELGVHSKGVEAGIGFVLELFVCCSLCVSMFYVLMFGISF